MRTPTIAALVATLIISAGSAGADPAAYLYAAAVDAVNASGDLEGRSDSFFAVVGLGAAEASATTVPSQYVGPTIGGAFIACDVIGGGLVCEAFDGPPTVATALDPTMSVATITMVGVSQCGGDLQVSVTLAAEGPHVHGTDLDAASYGIGPDVIGADVTGFAGATRTASVTAGTLESACLGSHTLAAGGSGSFLRGLLTFAAAMSD